MSQKSSVPQAVSFVSQVLKRDSLTLSVSVAVLGGFWAFIALGPLGGFALVWVGFIAAGCFFAAGDTESAWSRRSWA